MATLFTDIYKVFFSKVTEDMYMELTIEDTQNLVEELLLSSLHWFEFPRVDLTNYSLKNDQFNVTLTAEEQNIIATYMVVEWLGQQLASVELTRMKYSGSDFKFTSQANHMAKLKNLKEKYETEGFHLQRLYKRRKRDVTGIMNLHLVRLWAERFQIIDPNQKNRTPLLQMILMIQINVVVTKLKLYMAAMRILVMINLGGRRNDTKI